MVNVEPAFPRGKKVQRNILTKHVKKPEFSVKKYGATVLPEEKAVRLRPKERHQVMLSEKETDVTWTQQALDASNLSFRSIQEGMLVLGCVKRIGKAIIELFLPGRINAQVPISMISNAYSNRLKKMIDTGSTDCPTLNDLYRCGDLVYVTLLHKPVKPNVKLTFSLKPSDLHRSFAPSQLVPGLVMSATIVEKEDHGYSMDIGVRNVRAFLPEEKLGQNRDDVGRNLLCSIETVSKLAYKVTVILKAFDPDTPRVLNVEEEVDLNTIVPGCRVMFSVGEPVEHGLRGMLFDDMVPAYVNKNMLTKVTSTPEKYSMFKKIPATLLYVMPRTNQVFVSLTPYPNNRIEMNVSNGPGTIIEKAYVKSVDYVGIWFLFQNKYRALLPRNFLLSRIASSDNVDESVLMSNFQIGTTCKLAVVSYNPLENTYIVTNDPSTINEEILSPDDIIVGNTYKCRVCKVIDDGAYVIVGNVRGSLLYVYYDRNQPVQVNDTVLLRAVMREYDSPFVKFTNHPALVDESASILYDWDQLDATQNQSFHGIIFKQNCNNALVRFCNNIVGFMPKIRNNPQMANLRINTVYKFTVLEFDKATNKLVLTLASTDETIPSAVFVEATITCVHAAGVDVQTEDGKTGTIPSECLSEFGEHNSLYMRLLKEGRTVAVVQTNTDTYSMRLIPYFKEHPKHIESVESGALLKGSCSTVNGVLYVTPLLSNFSQQIEVKRKENYCEVKDGSIMMMRVLDVKKSSKEGYNLHVSTALLDVCENGKQDVFNFMVEYLKDVKNLIQRYQEANYAFANYTLGELVECVVESIVPESNKLAVEVRAIDKETKNAAKGIATAILPNQPASSYKVGKKVPGRVVWIDVERKLVHVCLDPPLVERILPEDSPMGTKYPVNPVQCWVLFANNYVQVCCLQTVPLNALVIVPVKHHYNDMVDRGNNTTNTVKVRLLWNYEKMFFAMQEQMVLFYEMCFATAHAKQGRIHRQQASKTIDEPSINEEDESENDAYDVSPMEGMTRVADNEGEDADATYDRMDEESDDGLSIPTPTTRSIINGKKQKKKATSKSSKKGDDKTKRKRKIVAEAMENVEQKQLALKKKKKKISPAEDLEVATVAKQPKSVSEKGKKSILLIGNRVSAEKPKLKKKKSPFVIDQLDGANDFYLQQLDGTGDIAMGEDKKEGARKRKRTTDGKGLPGAINFWDSTPVYKRTVSDSSDDEAQNSDDEQCETVGKMRLSAKERFEAMKKEEERLRKIEDELANPSMDPHTPDQFDRLVLAQPNNSMLWIRYMAFHMESAELDKARAVGRKALKAIHFREETDRLNVWMALLNLEIRYETVDSFKEVLQEAVQYNDAFKVYSRAVDILIDCQKHAEVQELLELLLKKFRKQNDMWFLVADAWYRIGQGGKVKPLLSQALKSLPVREHIPIIVKFAFLHNRNENRDEAHLLFEQILTSYPKRTDIWSQYIDMLVKDDLVGNARQILERAIMQRLPMKNMKTLYTKYVNFEETHGDRDSVRRVKQMAADYVQAQLNNAGIK